MRITESVRKLDPYTPGEQPKAKHVVKLNTNENPYPPSPQCADVLKAFDLDRLRRYPDPVFTALRARLAKIWKTVPERIFIGNGSDEVLTLVAKAFVEDSETIGSLDPSYSLYKTLAAIRNVPFIPTPLKDDFTWDGKIATQSTPLSLFLLTNPNAPTGTFTPAEVIASAAKRFKGVLLVDEAYADFAQTNCVPLATAAKNRNVIVMRTLSKSFSLAGLRLGYCIGPEDLMNDIRTYGLLFETMAVRDLRVYADALNGGVSHYLDRNGLECDAVVHLRNGTSGLVEVKLGGESLIEEGARTLNDLSGILDSSRQREVAFKMVVTATGDCAYQRKDGIIVCPISCLKP